MNAVAEIEFLPRDIVRLVLQRDDVPYAARGRVIGCFARPTNPTYIVSFEGARGLVEVRPDEIVRADDEGDT